MDIIYNVIKAVTWDEINTNKCDPPWENREKGERTGTRAMTRHANRVTCFSDMHICNKQNNECHGRYCFARLSFCSKQ